MNELEDKIEDLVHRYSMGEFDDQETSAKKLLMKAIMDLVEKDHWMTWDKARYSMAEKFKRLAEFEMSEHAQLGKEER